MGFSKLEHFSDYFVSHVLPLFNHFTSAVANVITSFNFQCCFSTKHVGKCVTKVEDGIKNKHFTD